MLFIKRMCFVKIPKGKMAPEDRSLISYGFPGHLIAESVVSLESRIIAVVVV